MTKALQILISNYTKHLLSRDCFELSKLYKLPAVLRGVDGECFCLRSRSQLNKYIAAKFISMEKKISVEYLGSIGARFSLLKEKYCINSLDNPMQNRLIIKEIAGKYWIIGESKY